ncbi:hypothetical protein SKAU_G00334640 [Synaphobranchus kaupii]|uniref:Uncharacterized protein n=1 Tax=Synaphobranchus kaupii TaxID=118154 RepID=A0A9Q1IGN1_SYNKA|nr:hypothetical protein SKAU_G00334640 [Synaphobranchus kaupii]
MFLGRLPQRSLWPVLLACNHEQAARRDGPTRPSPLLQESHVNWTEGINVGITGTERNSRSPLAPPGWPGAFLLRPVTPSPGPALAPALPRPRRRRNSSP